RRELSRTTGRHPQYVCRSMGARKRRKQCVLYACRRGHVRSSAVARGRSPSHPRDDRTYVGQRIDVELAAMVISSLPHRIRTLIYRLELETIFAGQGDAQQSAGVANRTIPPDDFSSIRDAAEHGDAAAQFKLGVRYATGQGVSIDESLAAEWIRRSAQQGYV